jgi:hypothetical protein
MASPARAAMRKARRSVRFLNLRILILSAGNFYFGNFELAFFRSGWFGSGILMALRP